MYMGKILTLVEGKLGWEKAMKCEYLSGGRYSSRQSFGIEIGR